MLLTYIKCNNISLVIVIRYSKKETVPPHDKESRNESAKRKSEKEGNTFIDQTRKNVFSVACAATASLSLILPRR